MTTFLPDNLPNEKIDWDEKAIEWAKQVFKTDKPTNEQIAAGHRQMFLYKFNSGGYDITGNQ